MENTKTVKALKKQLVAAIAMVLVAAIALGSSTYAWFVSNNTVKATTTTIAAQSNAAFMVIDKTLTSESSGTEDAYTGANTALYPAKVDVSTAAVTSGSGEKGYVWQSAFAATGDKSDMKSGTLFDIQGTASGSGESAVAAAATGTAAAAVQSGFAIQQTFYIGEKTGTTELANLRVSDIEMTETSTTDDLTSAMRVLIVCGNNWIVYDKDMTMKKTNIKVTDGKYILKTEGFKGVGTANQVTVDMYVYYDGDDSKVFTTNLDKLATAHGLTVSFTADNMAAGGSTGSTGTATTP
ncbi:MAG: hypothetical protein PUG00_04695 [Clostridiales bacterium]|nr:hypothetical protein [Clostridiales bacterium]